MLSDPVRKLGEVEPWEFVNHGKWFGVSKETRETSGSGGSRLGIPYFFLLNIWPMNSNLELTLSTFCNYSLLHSRPFIRRSWKHTLMITLTTSWLCRGVWARDPFQHFPPFGQLLRDQFWFETPKSRNSGCRMIQALCKSPYKLCPCRMQRELREKKSIRAHLKHARGHIVITEHEGWLNGDHRFGFDEGTTSKKSWV